MQETGIVPALHGAPLRDAAGEPVGIVEDLLVDVTTGRPAWLLVRTAERRTVLPFAAARPSARGMRATCDAAAIRACPVTLTAPELGREHVVRVCRHYGVRVPPGAWAGAFAPVRRREAAASPVAVAA